MSKINALWIPTDYYNDIDVDGLILAGVTDVFVKANRVTSPTYDTVLPSVISDLSGTSIRVHAWVTCFKDTAGDWVNADDSDHKTLIYTFIDDILDTCPTIDGINLDYVRYPGTGELIAGEQELSHGETYITGFVSAVRDIITTVEEDEEHEGYGNDYILSACLMPEMGINTYYYGQDYHKLSYFLDWQIPMAYTGNYSKPASWVKTVIEYVKPRIQTNKLLAGLQTYVSDADTTPKTLTVLLEEAEEAFSGYADGVSWFRYGLLDDYPIIDSSILPEQPAPPITDAPPISAEEGLVEGNKVAIRDNNGDWRVYEIKSSKIQVSESEQKLIVEAENIYYELGDSFPSLIDITGTPSQTIKNILDGSSMYRVAPGGTVMDYRFNALSWVPGTINVAGSVGDIKIQDMNSLAALREVSKLCRGELEFKVQIQNNQITGRQVNLLEQIGSWKGRRIEFGHDLKNIDIIIDHSEIKTAIWPQWKESSDSAPQDLSQSHWIEGQPAKLYNDGPTYPAPLTKPQFAGGFLKLDSLLEKYGLWNSRENKKVHRWMFSNLSWAGIKTFDTHAMIWAAYDELMQHATPLINIKAEAISLDQIPGLEHERLSLGDVVLISLDEDTDSIIPARVISYERVLNKPEESRYEFGNFQRTGTRVLLKNRLIEYPGEDTIRPGVVDGIVIPPDQDYTDPTGPDSASGTVSYSTYQDMLSRVTTFQTTYGRNPNYVSIVAGGSERIPWATWVDAKARVDSYITTYGRPPTIVYLVPNPGSGTVTGPGAHTISGYTVVKQNTSVRCGPASLEAMLKYYGCNITQNTLASWAGTTSNGTSPDGLKRAVGRAATQCSMNFTWFASQWPGWETVQNTYVSKNVPVILHHRTGPLPNYSGDYPHYAVMIGYNADNVLIADPGKGIIRWYTKTTFENAMKARAAFGSHNHVLGFTKG